MKQLIAFDLDSTLAASKQPIDDDMAKALAGLLGVAKVAVISGGDWPQFDKQVAGRLPKDAQLENLFLMPTTGTKLYRHQGDAWQQIYAENFNADERKDIKTALDEAAKECDLDDAKIWGERVEDRGSQITFSGLGQDAPLDAKEAWDPDREKRTALQKDLQGRLPDLSINVGGSTSIDITRKGVDKAYGLTKLSEVSGIAIADMLFVGDAIYPGGNDYPAKKMGMDTIKVGSPDETRIVIATATTCLG